jgi:hypothetical protein
MKAGEHNPHGRGTAGSEQGSLRAAPIAQESWCHALDGYLYTARGEQGEEIWVELGSGLWRLTAREFSEL